MLPLLLSHSNTQIKKKKLKLFNTLATRMDTDFKILPCVFFCTYSYLISDQFTCFYNNLCINFSHMFIYIYTHKISNHTYVLIHVIYSVITYRHFLAFVTTHFIFMS